MSAARYRRSFPATCGAGLTERLAAGACRRSSTMRFLRYPGR
jgi:hypothetical protein